MIRVVIIVDLKTKTYLGLRWLGIWTGSINEKVLWRAVVCLATTLANGTMRAVGTAASVR